MKSILYRYRIFGLAPEVPEGHVFFSEIKDLQNFPGNWKEECPYNISNVECVTVEQDCI
jgi:hypothetical protein